MEGQRGVQPINKAYTKLLFDMVNAYNYEIKAGTILIITWEDQQHLDNWMACKPALNDVRCFKAPLIHFPMIPKHTDKDVAALAVAIGKEKDFSDIKLVHYVVVQEK